MMTRTPDSDAAIRLYRANHCKTRDESISLPFAKKKKKSAQGQGPGPPFSVVGSVVGCPEKQVVVHSCPGELTRSDVYGVCVCVCVCVPVVCQGMSKSRVYVTCGAVCGLRAGADVRS